jgi:dTDP-4-dehydrorhamnose reductase
MIILLGGSGYVGQAYQKLFAKLGVEFRNLVRKEINYADPHVLADFLADTRPEFLVNAAGYTGKPNVDACEDDKANTVFGNAVLPGFVRTACERTSTPWGHVSSGCIYSGRAEDGGGFKEEDFPNFSFRSNRCSFYSGTKALGEEVLQGAGSLYVWRLRIPFNEIDNPRNYLTKLMRYERLLEAENSISQLDEFVAATFACWQQRVPFGTYNVTNPGAITTSEVASLIRASGVCEKKFQFFTDEDEFMAKAARTPRSNCVMDSSKLTGVGITLTEVHEAVETALRNWVREERKL